MTLRKRYLLRVDGMDICGRLIGIDDGLLTFDDVRQERAHNPALPYHCGCTIGMAEPGGGQFSVPHVRPSDPHRPSTDQLAVGRAQIAMMRENQWASIFTGYPRLPTDEQAKGHSRVEWLGDDGAPRHGHACYAPWMAVGPSVIECHPSGTIVDIWLWRSESGETPVPFRLMCTNMDADRDRFAVFGNLINRLLDEQKETPCT